MKDINPIFRIRVPENKKNWDRKRWFKETIDNLITGHNRLLGIDLPTELSKREQVIRANKYLYSNRIYKPDFNKVLEPYGKMVGAMLAKLSHKDIISNKVNSILGIDLSRPFNKRVIAVNRDATTHAEREELKTMINYIMSYIQTGNPKMDNQDDLLRLQRYIKRNPQTNEEILGNQLLEYFMHKLNLKFVFNQGLRNLLITNADVFYVGEENGEPYIEVIDPERITSDFSKTFIEDGDYVVVERRMTIPQIINKFGDQLTRDELRTLDESIYDYAQRFYDESFDDEQDEYLIGISIYHVVWKAQNNIKILRYFDQEAQDIKERVVDNDYELIPEMGDIELIEKWVPVVYEGWKIGNDIYVGMRELPGQFNDLDNLYERKLPYVGFVGDPEASAVGRARVLAYLYDIVMYRLELVLSSDRGKKLLMSAGLIPSNYTTEQFFEMVEKSPVILFNALEEGKVMQDVKSGVMPFDLSTAQDITRYVEVAKAIREEISKIMGVPDEMEGQISPYMTATNLDKTVNLSTNLLSPLFSLHSVIRGNTINMLLNVAKSVYARSKPRKLTYILDDATKAYIDINPELLDNVSYGVFVADNSRYEEVKQAMLQMAHAAMQNQMIDLASVIKSMLEDDVIQAQEIIEEGQTRQNQMNMEAEKAKIETQKDLEKFKSDLRIRELQVKGQYQLENTKLSRLLEAASFNPDVDKDKDNVNDFIELALKERKLGIEERTVAVQEDQVRLQEKALKQKEKEIKNKNTQKTK